MAAAPSPPPPPRGVEVPVLGSERLRWVELTVPSPISTHPSASPPSSLPEPRRRGASSCHVLPGDPPSYVVWRIHDDRPDALEIINFFPSKDFPECGIRLIFPEPLHPFSFVYKDQVVNMEGDNKMVYAVTEPGTAYLLSLRNTSSYLSGSIFPMNDLTVQDLKSNSLITAIASIPGCIVVGRQDGSVNCYKLGSLHQAAPGFMLEYRDDVGLGRLWNLMSRGKAAGPVQHIAISEGFGRKLLFAAHLDGSLRVWDLIGNTRLLNHLIAAHELSGATLDRLWVGEANKETGQIIVAVLYRSSSDMIIIYSLSYATGEKLILSSESSWQHIPLNKEKVIDLKITQNDVWILEEGGTSTYNLCCSDTEMRHRFIYNLQENFISDQLLQAENSFEDSMLASFSLLPSIKDQVPYVISSVFLRRLLQPGILLASALSATVLAQKKFMSQDAVQSLSVPELKQEIVSIIESQGHFANIRSIFLFWKKFCSLYIQHWCQNNPPYGLFLDDSSGVVCLIRKSSISLFRHLHCIEMLSHGLFDPCVPRTSSLRLPAEGFMIEFLPELFKCLNIIHCQLGMGAAATVLYECLMDPSTSCEDIVFNFVKEVNTGFSSVDIGEVTWDKRSVNHGTRRKFLTNLMASFHKLLFKATTWGQVLDLVVAYLKNLVPDNCTEVGNNKGLFNTNSCLLIHAATQTSKTMFELSFTMLIFLGILINVGPQVRLAQREAAIIKLKIIPMVWDTIKRWHILHFLGSTSTELPSAEDFSSKLSSLHIDGNPNSRSIQGKLGKSSFTLAFLLDFPISSEEATFFCSHYLPNPVNFIKPVQYFCSRAIWNGLEEKSDSFAHSIVELSCILLRNGQFEAAEKLLAIVDAHLWRRSAVVEAQDAGDALSACLHLLGFCILVRSQTVANGMRKECRIRESIRCFFRSASAERALYALKNLSFQTGLSFPCNTASATTWKFFYYQWAKRMFEQYNLSDAACDFAVAALEQIDEISAEDCCTSLTESPARIKGRLWEDILKYSLDLKRYSDAYCAIISNPDDNSKTLCLRRFIIVLCERNEMKILCDGGLPFVGLVEKVEKELIWKAERSDICSNPNLYKLLYGFEICCKNWRKAASYMYRYSVRLRHEVTLSENRHHSSTYQEVICALSASINALQLVNPSQAWIASQKDNCDFLDNPLSNKKARKVVAGFSGLAHSQMLNCVMDIGMLEKEYVLTLAQHLLCLVNSRSIISGEKAQISKAVDALIQENFYDMALTIIMKFCIGSNLKRELERVFIMISQKCCANYLDGSLMRIDMPHNLLLTSSDNEVPAEIKVKDMASVQQYAECPNWEMLERNLEIYKKLHPRLPVTVAETLLVSNPQIELPLWLVHMFKGGRRVTPWGMTGSESDPATLFRLYVDYGRYSEATNLLLEYVEALACVRPIDVTNRKRMSAVWFPYVAIERLVCHLEEVQYSGHMVDQCDRLKELLQGALHNHLKQIKVDSEDAMVSVPA